MKNNSLKKINVAIIGTGRIAGELEEDHLREHPCTHAGIFSSDECFNLIACASKNLQHAKKFSKHWNIPYYYNSYQKLFKNHPIDLLSICTPAPLHAKITNYAAKNNVKHIFCEKAMATNLYEANQMIQNCSKNHVFLTINHTRRWAWNYRSVKNIIQTNQIGNIQSITGYFSGNLMHTGTHLFDLLVYLLGPCHQVKAQIFKNTNSENIVSGYQLDPFKYDDPDVQAELDFSDTKVFINGLNKNYFIFELDIIGSNGRIRIGNQLLEYYLPTKSKYHSGFIELEKTDFPVIEPKLNPWLIIKEDLKNAIHKNTQTSSPGLEAIQSMEIGIALMISSNKNKPVQLPLKNKAYQHIKIQSK